jgi:amidophosphoribosyltransferase
MGGFFGVISKKDCVNDLFFGTDYHSHLGTKRGGLAVKNDQGFIRYIHNIENAQFRSKFENDISRMYGNKGIGVISVGAVQNIEQLVDEAFRKRRLHFRDMSSGEINPTELVATLINQESSFVDGIIRVQDTVEGSCSLLLLTDDGIYASRDKLGRTPVVIGEKRGSYAATLETCAFPNLDYTVNKFLGPGEILLLSQDGIEQKKPPEDKMQICTFLWVYYGYPASSYEGINVEDVRNRCGKKLAQRNPVEVDLVAGIPDSGTAHGLGYANESGVPFKRPFVKYTPTWPRSFMPQDQTIRDLVAKMKLIPVKEFIEGKRLLFCEDSIVRGTQLKDTIQRLFESGAMEVHMRPACPPLVYACKFLNFSRSRSEMDLAARTAIHELVGNDVGDLSEYAKADTDKYRTMIENIRERLNLTSLQYQRLEDLVDAIGLPKERLCTYCWDGAE